MRTRVGEKKETAGLACKYVRQVLFNAWHYAEADLWAGLAGQLAQLAEHGVEWA
ncbi:hypothetical protein ACFV0O_38770 [Kitasatospora sp. NPDC059577]|uniref:hypothetical protein n=1 Tax=Kitasatospora sp. NPDC059577 TaxID=3346873 RepID=UPI0036AEC042